MPAKTPVWSRCSICGRARYARFAAKRLAEDATGFLSSEELCAAYTGFLHDNDYEAVIDPQKLIRRLKELPGVKQLTRVASDGVRRRGLAGRKLIPT